MGASVSTKISDKREDDDYPFRKKVRDYKKLTKFYLVPISSVVIFIIIFIFTIIPNIQYMFDGLNEVNTLQDESKKLDNRINVLKKLKEQEDENRQTLGIINSLIPSETSEVVVFRQKVAEIGKQRDLSADLLKAGESILDDKDKNVVAESFNYQLIEIPSKFNFSGQFSSYRDFLKALYAGDDFFVISSMSLEANEDQNLETVWKGDFGITKYQFSQNSTNAKYSQVSETIQVNQAVVDFVQQNFTESELD